MRLNKRVIRATVAALCFVLVTQAAQAWVIPALSATGRFLSGPITNTVMWLGRSAAANPTIFKAFEFSIAVHGAIIGAVWFGNSDQTASTPIHAKLVISPNNDQPTVNPDPKRYNDTPSSSDSLQPAPKASFASAESTTPYPKIYPEVVQAIGGEGESGWYQYNTNSDIRYLAMWAPDFVQNGTFHANSCGAPATQVVPSGYDFRGWCGNVTGIMNTGNYVVFADQKTRGCPAGYTLSSGNCILTDEPNVMKPAATIACEVTRKSDNTWYIDPKNPECSALMSSITQSTDGKKITVSNGSGETVTVTENTDGSRDYDFQQGDSWRTIKTGAYDPGLDGRPVLSVTDGGGQNPNGDAGSGPGTSPGGGGSGGSGGSCGGSGQPACAIDDSGFDGQATDGDGLMTKIADHDQGIMDRIAAVNPADQHGMEWNWLPAIPRVACVPFEYGTGSRVVTIDMCQTFAVIRQALGWLLYIFMAWGLFELLMSGTTTKGRK